jgi:ABC-type transport system involved in multi-copper enzyme maturation permease subunit
MMRAAVWSPALSKEIRALLPLWGATAVALAAAFGGDRLGAGLLAYVAGSAAIGAQSIGQEYSYRTLPMLLSHPADRRRTYLLKFSVAAVMLLTLAALAGIVFVDEWRRDPSQLSVVILPVLCGLFLAPLFTMICRSSLAGMILSTSVPAVAWLITLAIAWFWFGIDADETTTIILERSAVGLMVLCPLLAVLGWRRFTDLEATEGMALAFHLPRWLSRADAARRHSPLEALAIKEVYLQQLTFGLGTLYIVVWAALLLGQRYIPSWSTFPLGAVMLLYCTGLAIMIGALASAEERQHRTLDWQLLQPTPAWQQWMVKVAVTLGLALVFGAGLPILLNEATPLEGFKASRLADDFALLIVLLTAGSIYISSLSGSGVRAMVLSLPVGIAVVLFAQIVRGALGWVTLKVASPLMANIVTGAVSPSTVDVADVVVSVARGGSAVLIPLLLWLGFVNHTSTERSGRRIFVQAAAIALVIATGIVLVGGILAVYELRAR